MMPPVSVKSLLACALFASAVFSQSATAQQSAAADSAADAAEVLRLTQKYSDAMEANDAASLAGMVAPGAWLIRSSGERQLMDDWIKRVASGSPKFAKHDITSTAVNVYGDVAVSVSDQTPSGAAFAGGPMPTKNTATRVWTKRSGQWKLILEALARPR
jgi:ketosteroid isomerase-like protein